MPCPDCEDYHRRIRYFGVRDEELNTAGRMLARYLIGQIRKLEKEQQR
ncbi:MAG: hypothetical protein OEN49_09110 [Gammaproteobacteria bacterium]|nr:hypothetical protein [Gammaproteobacteria bacterium]